MCLEFVFDFLKITHNLVLTSNFLKKLRYLFLNVVFVQKPPENVKDHKEIRLKKNAILMNIIREFTFKLCLNIHVMD